MSERTYVCLDNSGMEDKFDVGITYIGFEHTQYLLVVTDKYGVENEVLKERFDFVSDAEIETKEYRTLVPPPDPVFNKDAFINLNDNRSWNEYDSALERYETLKLWEEAEDDWQMKINQKLPAKICKICK